MATVLTFAMHSRIKVLFLDMTFSREKDLFDLISMWYKAVLNSSHKQPTAMMLATCSKDCVPSARVV
jgi:pyridoxamine 5'-phosphate oxidase